MYRVVIPIALVVLLAASGATRLTAPVWGQSMTPAAALERLMRADPIREEWFAPSFLAAVPLVRVQLVVADVKRVFGEFRRVEPEGGDYLVVLERGTIGGRVSVDGQGRVTALFFPAARGRFASVELGAAAFRALPGRVALLVLEDGRERASHNPDVPLAVASAFKLSVLAALKDEFGAGRRTWAEVVTLRPEWKSHPSGILQDWPDGSLITIQTLAGLMISRSDNTATDVLIHTLGRQVVEAQAPARNRPLLSTRELFMLEVPANQDLLTRYRAGNEAARREVLRALEPRPLPPLAEVNAIFARGPAAPDIQWFYTARELCALMTRVADLPLMTINPGLAEPRDWARVAYKGGSETGVFNLTTMAETRDRRSYCVAATANADAAVDEQRFTYTYAAMLGTLR
jgi:beta-lactamase class A